jgi:2-hydroxycyclohexanecarboxyl-CoA dehydrogenase
MTSVPSWTALARLTDRRAKGTPSGHRAGLLSLDICQSAVVDAVAQAATGVAGGRVDVLVNNVGDYRPSGRFLKTTDDEWNALYSLNLEHVFRGTRAIAPAMVANQSGSIVNVSTVEAFRGIPGNAVYSAFNAGVNAFTRSLAVETRPRRCPCECHCSRSGRHPTNSCCGDAARSRP